jgi:hypothetical protein
MSSSATRATRLLFAALFAWLGLALFAQAALATHGRVQVIKINQGGNASDTFAFHPQLTQSPGASPAATDFSIAGGQASSAWDTACTTDRPGHNDHCATEWPNPSLKITELAKPGYKLSNVTCRYTQASNDTNTYAGQPTTSSPVKPAGEVSVDLASGSVNLNVLHYDEWVVCWFTNTPSGSPSGSPPGSPPGTTPGTTPPGSQPQIEVSPARVSPGSAKLHGPSGCPTTSAVAATVTGKRIVKVTFYIDNKKVKTLTKPTKSGGWTLSVNMRRIAYGGHRVRAHVEFAKSSGTAPKDIRLSFNRCHAGDVRPQFTG